MAKQRKPAPSYRQAGQAVVTLTYRVSRKRKDVLLGDYDSEASRNPLPVYHLEIPQ
jgi:hypothetical protein